MIAQGIGIRDLVNQLPILGLLVLGMGYLVGQWRRGKREDSKETVGEMSTLLDVRKEELDRLRETLGRMGEEMRDLKVQLATTEANFTHSEGEREELRELVMGERVPEAMRDLITAVAQQNRDFIDERLHAVDQGIARLLAEREQHDSTA